MTLFINFVIIVFYTFLFIYIKISKNLSAKYYQEKKKKDYKKNLVKNIKVFPKKKKKKKQQYGRESCKNLSEDEKQACWVQTKIL